MMIHHRCRASMSHRRCCAILSQNLNMIRAIHCAAQADCSEAHCVVPADDIALAVVARLFSRRYDRPMQIQRRPAVSARVALRRMVNAVCGGNSRA